MLADRFYTFNPDGFAAAAHAITSELGASAGDAFAEASRDYLEGRAVNAAALYAIGMRAVEIATVRATGFIPRERLEYMQGACGFATA